MRTASKLAARHWITVVWAGLFSALISEPKQTNAATFEQSLTGFLGPLESTSDWQTAPVRIAAFDIGIRLRAIEAVYVDLTVRDETPVLVSTGESYELPLLLSTVGEGPRSSDYARRFNGDGYTHRALFDNYVPELLDFYAPFYDGAATLELRSVFSLAFGGGAVRPDVLRHAAGSIVDARVVIVGTPVPEPSTLALVAAVSGLAGFWRLSGHNNVGHERSRTVPTTLLLPSAKRRP